MAPGELEALAKHATDDPPAVVRDAPALLARARSAGDGEAACRVLHAWGLALRELNDARAALARLEEGVEEARAAGLVERGAQLRLTLGLTHSYLGDNDRALAEIDGAAAALTGVDRARAQVQRALILQRQGRLDDALDGYRAALPALRRAGDRLWEARLRNNRAILHQFQGRFADAEADYEAAARLFVELGEPALRAQTLHNLASVVAAQGAVPRALALFDEADTTLTGLGRSYALGLREYCETLLAVRLVPEARRLATRAVGELGAAGMASDLAEVQLLLAEASLLDGDAARAREVAHEAVASFAQQQRPLWEALARFHLLRASAAAGEAVTADELRAVAGALEGSGWVVVAAEARLGAARAALDAGDGAGAADDLARAARGRRRGPADLRVRAWHAEALLRSAAGDGRGAEAALRAGLRVARSQQAALGATELRAHVSAHASELAAEGLRRALRSGQARRVLDWAEQRRAAALLLVPATPPDDGELADELAALRRTVMDRDEALREGASVEPLLRQQVRLEEAIRRRVRRTSAGDDAGPASGLDQAQLARALGGRALVEYVEVDGELSAVVLHRGRARLHRLGGAADPHAAAGALRMAVARLADPRRDAVQLGAARATLERCAQRLQEVLLDPVLDGIDPATPLVLCPTGRLHDVAWSALPACRGRTTSVTPSGVQWLRASTQPMAPGGAASVYVAGPGLVHATGEVLALAAGDPHGTPVVDGDATVPAVLGRLDGAGLAHFAAHCEFRADNPLFSNLQLADGPLTVYDLERLARPPRQLVLAACESGRSAVAPGDELMGLSAAVLALGTTALVAGVVEVPDGSTAALMLSMHERRRRDGLAAALAGAQAELWAIDEPASCAAAAAFVCIGAG